MKFKTAIQNVKDKYEGWMGYAKSQKEIDELSKERDDVITMLKMGKKYQKLWKQVLHIYRHSSIISELKTIAKNIGL